MTDDNFLDDWLPLESTTVTTELQLGVITPAVIPALDLEPSEMAYRVADRATHNIVMVETDEATGEEIFLNPDLWAEILSYPPGRLPTIQEAETWIKYHDARLGAETYYAVEAARLRAEQPVPPQPSTVASAPAEPAPKRGPTA